MSSADKKPLSPWKVLSSKYLIQDPWITVRADHCETNSGAELNPFYVLEYTDWAHIAAFNDSGDILVVKQYRHGIGRVGYELPGGVVEDHEAPLEAIKRELLEETGHTCTHYETLIESFPNPATHSNRVHCVLGTGCSYHSHPNQDEAEDIEFEFVSVSKIFELIRSGEFIQSFHIPSIFLALQKLGRLTVSSK